MNSAHNLFFALLSELVTDHVGQLAKWLTSLMLNDGV